MGTPINYAIKNLLVRISCLRFESAIGSASSNWVLELLFLHVQEKSGSV
jgi:hypothetical protein